LRAYLDVSKPPDKEAIALARQQIVNEELKGITGEIGD
jgi:hypothetical protein